MRVNKENRLDCAALSEFGGGYYDFAPASFHVDSDIHARRGYLYRMGRVLTQDEKEKIESFDNTVVYTTKKVYAPEIVSSAVFLADVCFKKAVKK